MSWTHHALRHPCSPAEAALLQPASRVASSCWWRHSPLKSQPVSTHTHTHTHTHSCCQSVCDVQSRIYRWHHSFTERLRGRSRPSWVRKTTQDVPAVQVFSRQGATERRDSGRHTSTGGHRKKDTKKKTTGNRRREPEIHIEGVQRDFFFLLLKAHSVDLEKRNIIIDWF